MGDYLSSPNLDKHSQDGENGKIRYGVTSLQGWRKTMEDSHIANLDIGDGVAIFGVFDGHGGDEVAKYIEKHFIREFKKNESFKKKDYKNALIETFMKMDQLILSKEGQKEIKKLRMKNVTLEDMDGMGYGEGTDDSHAGAAGNVVLITKTEIYCANAGDCRAVLSKKGKAKDLSVDHKPNTPSEKTRIERANGFVEENRVNGNLALSRSIGDFEYKSNPILKPKDQIVTAYPDVTVEKIAPDCDFMIIACDGIWDCMSSQECVNYVKDNQKKKEYKDNLSKLIEAMLESLVAKEVSNGIGTDNMSCIVVEFKK